MSGRGYTNNWKDNFFKILLIVIWAIIIQNVLLLGNTQVPMRINMKDREVPLHTGQKATITRMTVDVINFNGTLINANPNFQKLPKYLNGPSYMDWYTQHY